MTTTTQHTYTATATREGKWWIITIPELDNAVTQARTVRQIQDMAAGLIIALLDLDDDTAVDVQVHIDLPPAVAKTWREATELQGHAETATHRAAELRREAVTTLLTNAHMSQTDAAAVLGLSHQRVQQLATKHPARGPMMRTKQPSQATGAPLTPPSTEKD